MSEAWARSGAMWLTGRATRPPLVAAGDPAGVVERALARLRRRTTDVALPDVGVLGERAALVGLGRRGVVTAGGAGRLLRTADGWVALSLTRPSDVDLVPALTERAVADDPWQAVARWCAHRTRDQVVERTALLGLAAAGVPDRPETGGRPGVVRREGDHTVAAGARWRVLDLSSLWAGPLCAHLLGLLGADVVKLESPMRPDGARSGHAGFYDLLHHGHRSAALDPGSAAGRTLLRRLVARADLVIEASRPRALRRWGLDADDVVAAGTAWLSITAYGREQEHRVGFGDDVAAGAGLVAWDEQGPVFAGDALADPLTGAVAAAAAAECLARGRAALVDVSMHDVARESAAAQSVAGEHRAARPRSRPLPAPASSLGSDTGAVVADWLGR
ncbi:CoA-transferase family III [Jatrophihabitans endophyticus]|uniref:CoA-transferase family III n=1 Tax=Jatrophihabitans endophyticus TaxID=1206085 RepID=A0A1M5PUQ9_9ACTN|nr:CoA transferase [Jatrophihabitans endophyticus]SHH05390.1 CoA-transferase family III [Jatrophihabitans endophyticus]